MTRHGRSGFTLLELLFVVTILGVLGGIAVPRYNRAVIRAEAAELGSRVNTVELGVREAQAMDGVVPIADGRPGVLPSALARFVPDSLFVVPVGVVMTYVVINGQPFGVAGKIPALFLRPTTPRAQEVLDALPLEYPRTMLQSTAGTLVPFDGRERAREVAGGPPTGQATSSGAVPPQTGTPASGSSAPPRQQSTGSAAAQPPVGNPPVGNPPVGTPPGGSPANAGPGGGGYNPPPTGCLGLGLPPGQVRQCQSGNLQSGWFRDGSGSEGGKSGSGGGHRH